MGNEESFEPEEEEEVKVRVSEFVVTESRPSHTVTIGQKQPKIKPKKPAASSKHPRLKRAPRAVTSVCLFIETPDKKLTK